MIAFLKILNYSDALRASVRLHLVAVLRYDLLSFKKWPQVEFLTQPKISKPNIKKDKKGENKKKFGLSIQKKKYFDLRHNLAFKNYLPDRNKRSHYNHDIMF